MLNFPYRIYYTDLFRLETWDILISLCAFIFYVWSFCKESFVPNTILHYFLLLNLTWNNCNTQKIYLKWLQPSQNFWSIDFTRTQCTVSKLLAHLFALLYLKRLSCIVNDDLKKRIEKYRIYNITIGRIYDLRIREQRRTGSSCNVLRVISYWIIEWIEKAEYSNIIININIFYHIFDRSVY